METFSSGTGPLWVSGIPRSPVYSPYKRQWRGTFSDADVFFDVSRNNSWTNSRMAGDLKHHGAHVTSL